MTKAAVIYADPAWEFETYSENGKDRSPEKHYDCMPLAKIKALPVREIAADDCALLMWTTDPLLNRAFEVIEEWGFKFKTVGFYWIKVSQKWQPISGQGYWTRANPEICILATRGKPQRLAKDVDRVIMAQRTIHSEKPHEAYRRIERLVKGPYLEMFCRHARPGWMHWGNEIGKLGGVPNPIDLPGYPSTVVPSISSELFQ